MGDTCIPHGADVFPSATWGPPTPPSGLTPSWNYERLPTMSRTLTRQGAPTARPRFATASLAYPDGPPHVGTLRAHPLGIARAPVNCGSSLVLRNARCGAFFGLAGFVYLGDVAAAEPVDTAGSAREVRAAVCNLFGFWHVAGEGSDNRRRPFASRADIVFSENLPSAPPDEANGRSGDRHPPNPPTSS